MEQSTRQSDLSAEKSKEGMFLIVEGYRKDMMYAHEPQSPKNRRGASAHTAAGCLMH